VYKIQPIGWSLNRTKQPIDKLGNFEFLRPILLIGLSLVKQSTDIQEREKERIREGIKSVHIGYSD